MGIGALEEYVKLDLALAGIVVLGQCDEGDDQVVHVDCAAATMSSQRVPQPD